MSSTNTINISFVVDSGADEAGRVMDSLIQHIQRISNVHSITAKHSREVIQWWNQPIEPSHLEEDGAWGSWAEDGGAPPTMERQQAVLPEDLCIFSLPTEEQMEAARVAFPGCDWEKGGEELVEEMETATASEDSEGEDTDDEEIEKVNRDIRDFPEHAWEILSSRSENGEYHRLTGFTSGGNQKASVIAYKRALLTEGVYRDEADEHGVLWWTMDGKEKKLGYWNETLSGFVIRPREDIVHHLQHFLADQNQE